jgi:hypothetical protein
MAFHCRAESRAAGNADALGRSVRDSLGGIESLSAALAVADGGATTSADQHEAARLLRAAARAYDEALRVAPRVAEDAGTDG